MSEQWQLNISHKKTDYNISLHNTTSNDMQFYIGDNAVHMVGEAKDLDVTLDNRLRFTTHINQLLVQLLELIYCLNVLLQETQLHLHMPLLYMSSHCLRMLPVSGHHIISLPLSKLNLSSVSLQRNCHASKT
jgi:hypothetical protein